MYIVLFKQLLREQSKFFFIYIFVFASQGSHTAHSAQWSLHFKCGNKTADS